VGVDLRGLVPATAPDLAPALVAPPAVLAFPVARGPRGPMVRILLRWLRAALPVPAVPASLSLRA